MISTYAQYIGRPWVAGAEGPNSWDCHAFTRHIQMVHFFREIPRVIIPDYDDNRAIVGLYNATMASVQGWRPVEVPKVGDVVVVRTPLHTGTCVEVDGEPCVLHCVRHAGVLLTKSAAWAVSGFGRRQYLRHESEL